MISLLLFLVMITSWVLIAPIALLYLILDTIFDVLGELALVGDMAGNVIAKRPMNDLLITKEGYQFGNRKETISSVLGKNKRDGTLTKAGKSISLLLDGIDPNHCIKSIDENVQI